jgi:DNA-binding response OmpR family regulator
MCYNNQMEKIKPLVLIIDDDKEFITIYTDKLSASGFRVESATNGKEGLAYAKKECPSIILLDLNMPNMDGKNVLEQIRACEIIAGTKVILFTSFHEYEGEKINLEYATRIGADTYLEKSVDLSKLVDKIKELLKK